MFTGIVSLAKLQSIVFLGKDAQLTITPRLMFDNIERGESIAVNGACLTVENYTSTSFTAFASAETLAVTTLRGLSAGKMVNIERALALGDRLGGHIVSGHVDCVVRVVSIAQTGQSKCIRVLFPPQFAGQIIPKGSITLNGISLTINKCGHDYLEVNVIPETQAATTVQYWQPAEELNFETDIIGKYIQHNMQLSQLQEKPSITLDFLRENGF